MWTETVLAYLEIGLDHEEGILFHGRVANTNDGRIGDIDSEEYVNLGHYSDSFRQRKGQPSPLVLHASVAHLEHAQIE